MKHLNFIDIKLSQRSGAIWLVILLGLLSLACSLGSESNTIWIRQTYPTLTPTVLYSSSEQTAIESADLGNVPESVDAQTAGATPVANQLPTTVPTITPTPVAETLPQSSDTSNFPSSESSSDSNANLNTKPAPTRSRFVGQNPTATPTSVTSNLPSTPVALPPSNPNPTATSPSAPPSGPTPALPPVTNGWSFVAVRTSIDVENAIVIGEMVNNTGIPQKEVHISGVVYDQHDQRIEEEIDTLSYVPVEVVPVGASVPFELIVEGPEPIYRLDLVAMSEPSGDPPFQDFQISNVNQWVDSSNLYCLGGYVQNSASPLEDFLIILASAYNDQGQLVSFGEYSTVSPGFVIGDQTSPFEMCVDPLDEQIVDYKLSALGR